MPVEGEQDSKHRKKLKKLERETRLLISPSRAKGGRSRRENCLDGQDFHLTDRAKLSH